jgi:hypothetical protein
MNDANDKSDKTELSRDLSSEWTDELVGLGSIREMTKGMQYGLKIEGGINPWYF